MKYLEWSGAERTKKCGIIITGKNLHFTGTGIRILMTKDLDLSIARYKIKTLNYGLAVLYSTDIFLMFLPSHGKVKMFHN